MSRELWAITRCEHGYAEHQPHKHAQSTIPGGCWGGTTEIIDFDAIWHRYYTAANRRTEAGLTYDELWYVVYGEKKEEE